jgi:large subunit ribosomal protein L23
MAILIKPIVTEKMTKITEKSSEARKKKDGSAPVNTVYGFYVDTNANKIQIKQAVEQKFGVTVESVNTINYPGKVKRRYTKRGLQVGKTASFKKAYVTLKDGDTIDFYANIN